MKIYLLRHPDGLFLKKIGTTKYRLVEFNKHPTVFSNAATAKGARKRLQDDVDYVTKYNFNLEDKIPFDIYGIEVVECNVILGNVI